jgi:hypothetical protein
MNYYMRFVDEKDWSTFPFPPSSWETVTLREWHFTIK